MPLNEQQIGVLLSAIKGYDYPAELYNFEERRKIEFKGMRELECYLRAGLVSKDTQTLKFALANIVYWGNINSGYCQKRTENFLVEVKEDELEKAIDLFGKIKGESLRDIKDIGLPQFSNMSFISKLRMFLDPENYVTLDRKLLKIKKSGIHTVFDGVSEQPTYIPINAQNCHQYLLWSQKCKNAANCYLGKGVIAVDVERGIFRLVDKGNLTEAGILVANI